jgi:hypothetical protein
MQVHLRLVADGITGIGMTTGKTFEGATGSDATFHFDEPAATFPFQAAFRLHRSDPNYPPGPPVRAQMSFSVTIHQSEDASIPPTFDVMLSQDTSQDN